jgi:photosynthetic reaction center cytochrome c subunit
VTMWFFAASLGVRCRYCHEEDNAKREMDTKPQKAMARRMIAMTMAINKNTFGGRSAVTCNTCHRGSPRPMGVPPVGVLGPPELSSSDELTKATASSKTVPSLDQILASYDAAVGGAGAAEKARSRTIKGTMTDINGKSVAVDIIAKGSETNMTVIHGREGDTIAAFNPNSGWATAERGARDMRPSDLDYARLESPVYVTGRIKQAFTDLSAQSKAEKMGDRDLFVVSGHSAGATAVRLYFDSESGLLARLVYGTQTAFGAYFTQIDYSDYRDMAGAKFPYRWKISRVRGDVADYKVDDMKLNVAVEDSKFAKPSSGEAAK